MRQILGSEQAVEAFRAGAIGGKCLPMNAGRSATGIDG